MQNRWLLGAGIVAGACGCGLSLGGLDGDGGEGVDEVAVATDGGWVAKDESGSFIDASDGGRMQDSQAPTCVASVPAGWARLVA